MTNHKSVWAIPLGGLGEFGMNMMALRCGDDIIVIDAGMMFPEAELLGVDIVIPDITYLKQNKNMVRAILLTHCHEDHIGALPYILRDLNVPIYGTQFTLALVRQASGRTRALLDKADAAGSEGKRRNRNRSVRSGIYSRDAQHD